MRDTRGLLHGNVAYYGYCGVDQCGIGHSIGFLLTFQKL